MAKASSNPGFDSSAAKPVPPVQLLSQLLWLLVSLMSLLLITCGIFLSVCATLSE